MALGTKKWWNWKCLHHIYYNEEDSHAVDLVRVKIAWNIFVVQYFDAGLYIYMYVHLVL